MDDRFLSIGSEKSYKFIIIGDPNVGKTVLFWRYTEGEFLAFKETQVTTIDFKMKNLSHKSQMVKLYIWDTAGQERFRSIVSTYFKSCHGMLLVFDQTNPVTFDNIINQWYPLCLAKTEGAKMTLVGNKIDLQRKVSQEQIKQWCDTTGIKYFPTSAKESETVEEPFLYLLDLILQEQNKQLSYLQENWHRQKPRKNSFGLVKAKNEKEATKRKCCK